MRCYIIMSDELPQGYCPEYETTALKHATASSNKQLYRYSLPPLFIQGNSPVSETTGNFHDYTGAPRAPAHATAALTRAANVSVITGFLHAVPHKHHARLTHTNPCVYHPSVAFWSIWFTLCEPKGSSVGHIVSQF